MRTTKGNENCFAFLLSLQKFIFFLVCQLTTVLSQCENGLEPSCIWTHDPNSVLRWLMKRERQELFVELANCIRSINCGIATINSPRLPPRDAETWTTIEYKIYGTTRVYLRLNMNLDDASSPHNILSVTGNYAHGYPEEWTARRIQIPASHTGYKLVLKALLPYPDAMVAVRNITLDGTVYLTSTSTTTSSTTPIISSSTSRIAVSTSTTSTTTTTTEKPITEAGEKTSETKKIEYFEEDEEEDEGEKRFQALEVEDFIGEEDLIEGYTKVVEPQLCMYK